MSEVIELEVARKNRLAAEHRASFGSWEDWSADEIMYLLRQLRDGHWENCGEPMEGFAIAVGGLSMAIDANEDEGEEAVRGVLTVFGRHRLHVGPVQRRQGNQRARATDDQEHLGSDGLDCHACQRLASVQPVYGRGAY